MTPTKSPRFNYKRNLGRKVEIKKKDKKSFGKVESAFLKDTTDVYDISFQTEK